MSSKYTDAIGNVFGKLTIIGQYSDIDYKPQRWLCKCACGKEKIISSRTLRRVTSCGCDRPPKTWKGSKGCQFNTKIKDITGCVYGRLTVVSFYSYDSDRRTLWLCKCVCGTIKVIPRCDLSRGDCKSCGCLNTEVNKKRCGPKSPVWNPNIDRINAGREHDLLIPCWRKKIYERDNYQCQICLSTTNKLNAHHLNNYAKFPNDRYLIENGITLCVYCHRKLHKTFGKFTTKLDYEKYKETQCLQ